MKSWLKGSHENVTPQQLSKKILEIVHNNGHPQAAGDASALPRQLPSGISQPFKSCLH
jgi:hypothetical protein